MENVGPMMWELLSDVAAGKGMLARLDTHTHTYK